MNWQLWPESPVNRFLLCAVLAKQTRRLGRLIPEMRVAELIGMALQNCTECESQIEMGDNTPYMICEDERHMFSLLKHSEACPVSPSESPCSSQMGNGVSVVKKQTGEEDRPGKDEPCISTTGGNADVPMGDGVCSFDSCCHLPSLARKYSMSNANVTDRMRQLQLLALAQNLYTLAKRHHENRNYVVAHALYGRALDVAQGVDGPDQKESASALRTKIQNDRQTLFDMLRHGESGLPSAPRDKAQKVFQ